MDAEVKKKHRHRSSHRKKKEKSTESGRPSVVEAKTIKTDGPEERVNEKRFKPSEWDGKTKGRNKPEGRKKEERPKPDGIDAETKGQTELEEESMPRPNEIDGECKVQNEPEEKKEEEQCTDSPMLNDSNAGTKEKKETKKRKEKKSTKAETKERNKGMKRKEKIQQRNNRKPASRIDIFYLVNRIVNFGDLFDMRKFNNFIQKCADKEKLVEYLLKNLGHERITHHLSNNTIRFENLKIVFQFTSNVLLNLTPGDSSHHDFGVKTTKDVIKTHSRRIFEILESEKFPRIREGLACLQGMIAVGGEACRIVYEFLTSNKHYFLKFLKKRNLQEDQDVRGCFVEMILEFIGTDDPSFLEKFFESDWLLEVFEGLQFDRRTQVLYVLEKCTESILTNPLITMTLKFQFFKVEHTKHLINLAHWECPYYTNEDVKEQEETEVNDGVIKFFLLLFTSTKHGLRFRPQGFQKKSIPNRAIHILLSCFKRPWDSQGGQRLMGSIFAASPELLPMYLDSIKNLLFPRSSPAFLSLMGMLAEIMRSFQPWKQLSQKEIGTEVSCLFPGFPLNESFYLSLCRSEQSDVRYIGNSLMVTVLRKMKETVHNLKFAKILPDVEERIQCELHKKASVTFTKQIAKAMVLNWKLLLRNNFNDAHDPVIIENEAQNNQVLSKETNIENDESNYIPATVEIMAIFEFFCCYNEAELSSVVEEVLDPLGILNTVEMVNESQENILNQIPTLAKTRFWASCHSLFLKSIANRKLSLNVNQLQDNIFYILIRIIAQSPISDKESFQISDIDGVNFQDILLHALSKTGISDDCEGIQHWIRQVSGPESVKLATFLTHVMQQTELSYNQYTDELIDLRTKHADLETAHLLVDNDLGKTAVIPRYNKPFSRLVFGALELLRVSPDGDHIKYFTQVMIDYLHTLHNPTLLISFLLDKDNLISDALKKYLGYFVQSTGSHAEESVDMEDSNTVSEVLMRVFMNQNFSSVDKHLRSIEPEVLMKSDIQLAVMQVLIYLQIELKKGNSEHVSVANYTNMLRSLYVVFLEKDEHRASLMIKSVLEHSQMIHLFNPAQGTDCPITSLCLCFIELVYEKYNDSRLCTYPYFLKTLGQMRSSSADTFPDLWHCVTPFIVSEKTVLNYDDLEDLFLVFLKTVCPFSEPHSASFHQVLKLLSKATNVKKQPREETLRLIFYRYLEWNLALDIEEHTSQIHKDILTTVEEILLLTLTNSVAKDISANDLEKLLNSVPSSCKIACKLIELHSPHGMEFALLLEKYSGDLSTMIPLIALLLKDPQSRTMAQKVLAQVMNIVKESVVKLTQETRLHCDLFLHALNADIMAEEVLVDIAIQIYEKTTEGKVVPAGEINWVYLLFQKISKSELVKSILPLGDVELSLTNMLFCIIKNAYKEDTTHTPLLLDCCQSLRKIAPFISEEVLQNITIDRSWASFVKQILRVGLEDKENGPQMIDALHHMINTLHKNIDHIASPLKEGSLSLTTIYKMIISHTGYLTLVFQRKAEWDALKGSVIALQQAIVDFDDTVCIEAHVPTLLGAYGASMSSADQRILKLLHTYEKKNAMSRYQPLIFGERAISHFGDSQGKFKEPSRNQILAPFQKDKILKSCKAFNPHLSLEPEKILGDDRSIYDLRFLVPLMLYVAEEKAERKETEEIDFAENGATVLGFTCLTAYDKGMWGAGALLLKHVYDRMDKSKHSRFKLPWIWTIKIISATFDGEHQRLPTLIAHYLIRVTLLLSRPQDPMYFPILRSVFVRPTFEFTRVPQLSRLYASTVLESPIHLMFLLNFLASGIQLPEDYFICEETNTSMMIVSLLQSPSTEFEIKVQALEVLASLVRIPVAAQILVSKHNILTVLPFTLLSYSTTSIAADGKKKVNFVGKSSIAAKIVIILEAIWASMFIAPKEKPPIGKRSKWWLMKSNKEMDGMKSKSNANGSQEENQPPAKKPKLDMDSNEQEANAQNDSDKEEVDENPAVEDTKINNTLDDIIDVNDQSSKTRRRVKPMFIEEYLNCLIHLLPEIIKHSLPVETTKHLTLVAKVVKYVLEVSRNSKKETLRFIALDPAVVKERVNVCMPWSYLYELLKDNLTDVEEVKILNKFEDNPMRQWRHEPIFQTQINETNKIGNKYDKQLVSSVFDLLNLLELG